MADRPERSGGVSATHFLSRLRRWWPARALKARRPAMTVEGPDAGRRLARCDPPDFALALRVIVSRHVAVIVLVDHQELFMAAQILVRSLNAELHLLPAIALERGLQLTFEPEQR